MVADEKVLLAVLGVRDAEILESRLLALGISIATIFNHSTCKTGCSPSKEIWAHPLDVASIQKFITEEHLRVLKDLGADPELIQSVYDPDKTEATCPACGHTFPTKHSSCPECGLVLGTS